LVVLVLSDIHGNFHALKEVLNKAAKYKWKELWFLGDMGGYGPRPEECFQLLKQKNSVFIPGNHDLYLSGQLSGSSFSEEARRSLITNRGLVKKSTVEVLKDLPLKQTRKGITLVHGSPENPAFDYILNETDAIRNFSAFKGSCCLFGHSHVQEYFKLTQDELDWQRPENGTIINFKKSRILINPGSIGQPRDRDPRAAWGLLDTRKKEMTFFRTDYDITATQREMQKIGSSEFLIQRLSQGI